MAALLDILGLPSSLESTSRKSVQNAQLNHQKNQKYWKKTLEVQTFLLKIQVLLRFAKVRHGRIKI
jgi:hypothetical protein